MTASYRIPLHINGYESALLTVVATGLRAELSPHLRYTRSVEVLAAGRRGAEARKVRSEICLILFVEEANYSGPSVADCLMHSATANANVGDRAKLMLHSAFGRAI